MIIHAIEFETKRTLANYQGLLSSLTSLPTDANRNDKILAYIYLSKEERVKQVYYLNIMPVQLLKPINFHANLFIRKYMTTSFEYCRNCVSQSHQSTKKLHTNFKTDSWWYDKWRISDPFLQFKSCWARQCEASNMQLAKIRRCVCVCEAGVKQI